MFKLIHLMFVLGFLILCGIVLYTFKSLAHGRPYHVLFKDFKRKICMTLSLGSLFFGLYLLLVGLSVYFVRDQNIDLFFLVYQNPVKFIYGGLWVFACLSLSIYLARMLIKYFYLTRGKDS